MSKISESATDSVDDDITEGSAAIKVRKGKAAKSTLKQLAADANDVLGAILHNPSTLKSGGAFESTRDHLQQIIAEDERFGLMPPSKVSKTKAEADEDLGMLTKGFIKSLQDFKLFKGTVRKVVMVLDLRIKNLKAVVKGNKTITIDCVCLLVTDGESNINARLGPKLG